MFAAFLVIVTFSAGCSDSNDVTGPTGPEPFVRSVEPIPTRGGSWLVFTGQNFNTTSTFTLQQGGIVKATLIDVTAWGVLPSIGIQIEATVPVGTPIGTYSACATTTLGTGCFATPVEVF